jgi:Tfp pilus assembly protein PilF
MAKVGGRVLFALVIACWGTWVRTCPGQTGANARGTNEIRIVELQGEVEVSPAGATTWVLTRTNQVLHPFDRLRTGENSRVALRWSDRSVVPFGASTELEILPPNRPDAEAGLHLVRGIVSFFHRDEPGRIRVITRGAVAGVEGTEFVMAVEGRDETERTRLSVIDGRVQFGNEHGTILLTNGQQAIAEWGGAPQRTAGFAANNVLQWCFYYPAVLDPGDLALTHEEKGILVESMEAYRSGDLLAALAAYPKGREPQSDAERVYYAALLLSVGQVERAEAGMASLSTTDASSRSQRLAIALRRLICAVKRQPQAAPYAPELATEFLANSYYEQSRGVRGDSLDAALNSARQAVERSPGFGFGWARVAELEFSFGVSKGAMAALDRSLVLAPRNAEALALRGFFSAAQNRTHEALGWFDRALAVDSALGNAWLGRGLCRIHLGDGAGGREDLLVAAAVEPQRAELRSYLGKSYADGGDDRRAAKELELAKRLDSNDPTAWLYSALLEQQNNRINEGIRDLEKSEELNDNRSVYRSELLLDQDRAVRSANLAALYRDAGMFDVGLREASRAVNYDYANFSAHLFLANSYMQIRDPQYTNLRYETVIESEYWLANLLAPVSAGPISSTISQQEYAPLFEHNRLGVSSSTEYLSRGAWTESAAQYGTLGNLGYDVEGYYRSDRGQRLNDDFEERQFVVGIKEQITARDTVYLQATGTKLENGDLTSYYNPDMATLGYRSKEDQMPLLGVGYHHEWSPGVHTVFLAARLTDTMSYTNPTQPTFLAIRPGVGPTQELAAVNGLTMRDYFKGQPEIYSGELQQIWEQDRHNTIIGGRFEYGHLENASIQGVPSHDPGYFPAQFKPAAVQDIRSLFERVSLYGYHQWQVVDALQLTGGVTYDWLRFPVNYLNTPISPQEESMDQVSPKAGLIWTPWKNATVRFAYTRSLGGVSFDQSYRLEPSQVAGFIQSFRSIIPETVVGSVPGAKFETYGLSLEQKLQTGTYLGASAELLNSKVLRTVGSFDGLPDDVRYRYAIPSPGLRQNMDYSEPTLLLTANQLLGEEWSLGARYRLSRAVLNTDFVDVPDHLPLSLLIPRQRFEGVLQQLSLFTIYNHPCGFFAEGEALWYAQRNIDTPAEPGDDFWQLNAYAGYRILHRRAELEIGVLNLTSQDYHLDPLNIYNELPRERTVMVRLDLSF